MFGAQSLKFSIFKISIIEGPFDMIFKQAGPIYKGIDIKLRRLEDNRRRPPKRHKLPGKNALNRNIIAKVRGYPYLLLILAIWGFLCRGK